MKKGRRKRLITMLLLVMMMILASGCNHDMEQSIHQEDVIDMTYEAQELVKNN